MIASHDHTDSTHTCWCEQNTTSEWHTVTVIYNDKEDEPELEYDDYAESFKPDIREWHNNHIRLMTKQSKNVKQRANNRQMNHNSGRFWHVGDN